ncbi:MAG: DUF4232 domain-containing protein, partial [Actinobacteria bacterium]|nr:DUF4232 domain-containing protein [Actinomycetota bacterium]
GAATASAATCKTANLVIWLQNGNGNGTAGSVYYKLRLTNAGSAACTVTGFPQVTAVNLKGQTLGKAAKRETNLKASPVTIAPGNSASFQVRVVEAGNFPASQCHPTLAAGWRVVPPGGGGAKVVPFPFETCAKPTQSALGVGPVKKS